MVWLAKGAKNIFLPCLSPLQVWGSLGKAFTGKFIWLTISSCYSPIPLTLALIGRDGGLSTLCHSWGFICCSEDGIVWLLWHWHSLVSFELHKKYNNSGEQLSKWGAWKLNEIWKNLITAKFSYSSTVHVCNLLKQNNPKVFMDKKKPNKLCKRSTKTVSPWMANARPNAFFNKENLLLTSISSVVEHQIESIKRNPAIIADNSGTKWYSKDGELR